MNETMSAVVVDGRGGIAVVEKPIPQPGPFDVVVAPQASGVYGTDLHLVEGTYAHGRYPVTPGHEFAGVVVHTGKNVTRVQEGDFVGVDPNINCGHCRWCRRGAPNLCPDLKPVGISVDGSCAEYVSLPESIVYTLPPGIDAAIGALVEPLSCVLHAVDRTPGWKSSRVAVFGAGPIGLRTIAVAKHLGSGSITAFEPHARRRELALLMGAEAAHPDASLVEDPDGFDIAVEASGHLAAIQRALEMLGRRGRLVQMGVANKDAVVGLAPFEVFAKELMIIGSSSLADAYPAAVDMIPALADTLRPLITDQVPLSHYAEALERAKSPKSIKVQVLPD